MDSLDGGSARRKASICIGQHNTEKRGHTSMPWVRFKPMIPVFERPKTVSASDRSAIGTRNEHTYLKLFQFSQAYPKQHDTSA
jgi:hypothetical protein